MIKATHVLVPLALVLTACSSAPPDTETGSKPECQVPSDCDDGDACTNDLCTKALVCSHPALTCDDNDACTVDTCDPASGCKNKTAPCDDDIDCTIDKCDAANGCKHTPDDDACDDDKVCTDDKCDKAKGCVNATTDCDDGNACTDDTCNKVNGCVSTETDCDDDNACTTDTCDKTKGCVHKDKPCDDDNLCTTDNCDPESGCKSKPQVCDDGFDCTIDTCNPAVGCVATPDSEACDDANVCTTDKCDKMKGCVHTANACDDGDPCTADVCDKFKGCTTLPKDCSDGNSCTTDGCDKTNGNCKSVATVCDDGLECTADTCDPAIGCKFEVKFGAKCGIDGFCDASAACNKCAPTCVAGSCTDGCGGFCPGMCDDGNACTTGDACDSGKCQGVSKVCDDGNACTKDSCEAGTGCKNVVAEGLSCGDGNPCTENDVCASGSCSGTPKSCDDANECTVDSCDAKEGCKHVAKTVGTCGGGAGKCIDGGCCVPQCGTAQCGDDGCGSTCGTCGATSACVSGKCELVAKPKIEAVAPMTFPVGGDQVVPGYVAHLYGTKVGSSTWNFALVKVKNPTSSPVSTVLTVELQGFSAVSETKLDLNPGESQVATVNLTFKLPDIYALSSAAAANLKVTLSVGGELVDSFKFDKPLKIATKNTVFWSIAWPDGTTTPMDQFVTTLVTPKNLEVQKLLSAAANYSVFKSMAGYQKLGYVANYSYSVAPGQCSFAFTTYVAKQVVKVSAEAAGGASNNASYLLLDSAATTIMGSTALGSFTSSKEITASGVYMHAMCNPSSNWSNRTFTVARTMGANEVAEDQLAAIFQALKAKGILYTSVAEDFFAGAQNVKTPGESLVTNSANCIDGTLVFASALEALSMEPILVVLEDHAYVAVRQYPGAPLESWSALETTMVGTATAAAAISKGNQRLTDEEVNGKFEALLDVKQLRSIGIVPGSF
jgi:hypothetical protein